MQDPWRVAQPCEVDPSSLAESGFCEHCQKTVHDISKLTRKQALALYHQNGGQLCGKLQHDANGQVQFRPEPPSALARASLIGISLLGSAAAAEHCSVEIRASDPSGAMIPNAAVTLHPKQAGNGWAGVLNAAGIVQTQVASGSYLVQVHSPGFKTWKQEIVCGEQHQPVQVDAVLEVGEILMGQLIVEPQPSPMRRAKAKLKRIFGSNR